jgi:integrase
VEVTHPGSVIVHYRARLRFPRQRRFALDETYATEAEARRGLATAQSHLTRGEPIPDYRQLAGPLLDEYATKIQDQKRAGGRPSTEAPLRWWIRPYFGGMTLEQMNSAPEMTRFVTHLRSAEGIRTHRPLADATIRGIVWQVGTFLQICVQEKRIHENAARGDYFGKPHKTRGRVYERQDARWFSREEALRYQEAARGVLHGDLCVFLLRTCLRSAEARGLLIQNLRLDLERPSFDVMTQTTDPKNALRAVGEVGPRPNPGFAGRGKAAGITPKLKTPASYRPIDLDPETVMLVRDRLAWRDQIQGRVSRWDDRFDLVFTTKFGVPLTGNQLGQTHRRICDLAGVRRIPLHGLRHTGLSLLIAAGVSLPKVAKIAGHSTVAELVNTYLHVIEDSEVTMASILPMTVVPEAGPEVSS